MSHLQWIESIIDETVKNNGFYEDYCVKVYAENAKGDNYGSDIAFVEVFSKNDEEKPVFNLFMKYLPLNVEFMEKFKQMPGLFKTEINIYTKIIPRYQELQKRQNQPLMDFTPKCLYTKETENNAVIVLENIKPHGFTLHPKEKSMDSAHIRLLLKSLAQWHALSFVLKDQYVEEFKKLNETHKVSPWGMIFETHLSKVYDYSHKALHQILEETGEYDVLSKFKAKFKNLSAKEMMDSLLNNDKSEKHAILIHGDCWNGNFMFQYSDQDHTEPTKVQILDFQIASLRSPIIDVSEFIYSTASSEEFKNIRQILMEYYADLARNIRALGSDPDQVFSFSVFKEQWHKYSIHGITVALLAPVYLHLDDEPLDVANEEAMFDILPKQIAKPVVRKRMTDMAKCFASFEF